MNKPKFTYYVGDFETTVYDKQDFTEVWASALVQLNTEDVQIFHSIDETYEYIKSLKGSICIYYHNLKFDGQFWIYYLLNKIHYTQAIKRNSEEEYDISFLHNSVMLNNTFKYSISEMGYWYTITIKQNNRIIELRDSLKLLPFSVKKISKSFGTKHKKLDIEYTGFRYAGCEITDKEKSYIANDVLVVKEALEIMFSQGHTKLTIGSCCLAEYKRIMGDMYKSYFPDMYSIPLDEKIYGENNAGDYIRNSYKGGYCYLVKGKENKIYTNGLTADVNSLYPSMMHSESGNYYPIGKPHFWSGNRIPLCVSTNNFYYFIRIKTRFFIKPNKLPCIQIKGDLHYKSTEWLTTSDIKNPKTGLYSPTYISLDGKETVAYVTLTLTKTDYELIKEHYELIDCEILDGCYFSTEIGIFDEYIDKYKKIKLENTGAIRELAKLFLNNLYGKLAANKNSSFKYAYETEDSSISYVDIVEYNKKAGYIPVGSAITSYARNFTIRTAQKNYYGKDKAGFIYADTDSIHCDLTPDQLKDVPVDDKAFCHWKLESSWDYAIFSRQKTYIEHIVQENLKPIDEPYLSIKCAGMPDKCKQLFTYSLLHFTEEQWKENHPEIWETLNEEEKEFVLTPRTISDFTYGLKVPSKLMPKRIKGGVVLVNTTYEMR